MNKDLKQYIRLLKKMKRKIFLYRFFNYNVGLCTILGDYVFFKYFHHQVLLNMLEKTASEMIGQDVSDNVFWWFGRSTNTDIEEPNTVRSRAWYKPRIECLNRTIKELKNQIAEGEKQM